MFDYVYYSCVTLGNLCHKHRALQFRYSKVSLGIFHFHQLLVIQNCKYTTFLENLGLTNIIQNTAYLKNWRTAPTSDYDICFLQMMKFQYLQSSECASIQSTYCREQRCFRSFYFSSFVPRKIFLKVLWKRNVRTERLGSGMLYLLFYFQYLLFCFQYFYLMYIRARNPGVENNGIYSHKALLLTSSL